MMIPEDYGLTVEGLTLVSDKEYIDIDGNITWRLLLLDLMSSGTPKHTLAAAMNMQSTTIIRLLADPKAQPSFNNGCRILAFYARVQKSTKI